MTQSTDNVSQAPAFTIAADVPPESRRLIEPLIEAINDAAAKIGLSADEMDRHFCFALMQQVTLLGNLASIELHKQHLPADVRVGFEENAPHHQRETIQRRKNEIAHAFGNQDVLTIKPERGTWLQWARNTPEAELRITQEITRKLNQTLGRFQDAPPSNDSSRQQLWHDRIVHMLEKEKDLLPKTNAPRPNLLQALANGKLDVFRQTEPETWRHKDINYIGKPLSYHVTNAIFHGMSYAAAAKGWSVERQKREIGAVTEAIFANGAGLMQHFKSAKQNTENPSYPASYAASPDLPEPQKQFFTALNKVIECTGDHAVMFDHNLRSELYTMLQSESFDVNMQMKDYLNQHIKNMRVAETLLDGKRPDPLADELKPVLARNHLPCEDMVLIERLRPDMGSGALQKIVQKAMHSFMVRQLPGFEQLSLSENAPLQNPHNDQFVRDTGMMIGKDAIKPYTGKHLLLGSFAAGKGDFPALVNASLHAPLNDYFDLSHAPVGAFLMQAIEANARSLARDNKRDEAPLNQALDELKNAYKAIAFTPEQRHAQEQARLAEGQRVMAEAQLRRDEQQREETRRQEELLLTHSSYGTPTKMLRSIETRATRKNPAPEKELIDAWSRISPLTQLLNRNFKPHLELGDALFLNDNELVLHRLDHVCTGAPLPAGASAHDAVLRILSEPVEQIAPQLQTNGMRQRLIDANRTRHQQVQSTLLKAPLLIISALGTPEMLADARAMQELLFPEKKKDTPNEADAVELRLELRQIAAKALTEAFKSMGKPLPDIVAAEIADVFAAPQPPAPPKQEAPAAAETPAPATATADADAKWSDIQKRVEKIVEDVIKIDTVNPYVMFRCRIGTEAGHPLTLEFSRWVGNGQDQQAESQKKTVAIDCADFDEAMHIKKRVQAHILNTAPIIPHRKLHNGHYTTTEYDPFPDARPQKDPNRPEPDGKAGRLEERGGVWSLRLLFSDAPATQGGEATKTETYTPLGIHQFLSRDIANARRELVLDHLEQLRERNQQFAAAGQQDKVLRVTSQDVRLWLEKQVTSLQRLSKEAEKSPLAPELESRIHALADAWQHPIPAGMQALDWLAQQAERVGTDWQKKAHSIKLSDPEHHFATELTIDFPPAKPGEPHRTKLKIHNPKFSGAPTPFWSAQIEIFRDGEEITSGGKRLNLHLRADTGDGPGSNPEMIIDRLRAGFNFIGDVLTAYAKTYPETDWHTVGTPPLLGTCSPHELRAGTNIDLTRWDTIIDALPFTGMMTVETIPSKNGSQPDADNKVHFALSFNREDGSQFHERKKGRLVPVPAIREFTLPAAATPEETQAKIRTFAKQVQQSFTTALEELYSPFLDAEVKKDGPQPAQTPPAALAPEHALSGIVSQLRNGLATRSRGEGGSEASRMKPISPYNPSSVIKAFDLALKAARSKNTDIEPDSSHTASSGRTAKPTDPAHRRPPTAEHDEMTRGFRRRYGVRDEMDGFIR